MVFFPLFLLRIFLLLRFEVVSYLLHRIMMVQWPGRMAFL